MNYKSQMHAISLAIAICLACRIVSAQNAPPQTHTGDPIQLHVVVDGSMTPEQIPDALAYQHFLMAVAAHSAPSMEEQARQAAQLSPMGLSAADRQALISVLSPLREQLDGIELARSNVAPGPSASAKLVDLNAQVTGAVATARVGLIRSLTTDGLNRLDRYVQTHVKARIKVYGGGMN